MYEMSYDRHPVRHYLNDQSLCARTLVNDVVILTLEDAIVMSPVDDIRTLSIQA